MSEIPPAPSPKKEIIAPHQESIAEEFADDPPDAEPHYGEARLWLVARDPRCLFAYWEFRSEEHPDAIGADGRAQFFLRICREGETEATIGIEPGSGNVFIPAQSPDCGYSAELGFFTGGVWCFLAHSGNTRTPPELPDAHEPAIFATIPASVSLGKMRDLLAGSALPGESLAMTAARIQNGARQHGEWAPEHERLLAEILGASTSASAAPPANSVTLAQTIRQKLAATANAATPGAPIPASQLESASTSSGASRAASPGETSKK